MLITSIASPSAAHTHLHAWALNSILTKIKIYMGSNPTHCLEDSAASLFTFASISTARDVITKKKKEKRNATLELHYFDTRGHIIPHLDVI